MAAGTGPGWRPPASRRSHREKAPRSAPPRRHGRGSGTSRPRAGPSGGSPQQHAWGMGSSRLPYSLLGKAVVLKRIHFYNNPHGFAASRPPHSVPQPPGALAAALPCHGLLRVVQRKKMQPCNHHVRSWRLTLQYFIFIIFFQARWIIKIYIKPSSQQDCKSLLAITRLAPAVERTHVCGETNTAAISISQHHRETIQDRKSHILSI